MVLALILAFFGWLASPFGLLTLLLGLVAFVLLPALGRVSERLNTWAHLPLWLGARAIGRMAWVVSEHNELYAKNMRFDDNGVEVVSFDDVDKEFEDPDNALTYWKGVPVALADEVHGVLFDPRHAALGQRVHDAEQRNEMQVYASDEEFERKGITHYIRGVFGFGDDHELVDLSRVRSLVDGGERAEYPARAEEYYINSREPYKSGSRFTKFLYPLIALLGTFAACWLIASQGSGGGVDTTIGFGASLLLLALPGGAAETLKRLPWLRIAGTTMALSVVVLPLLLIAVLVNPVLAVFAALTFALGYLLIPLITLLARPSALAGGLLGKACCRIGMLAFRSPVYEWTSKGYRLREQLHVDGDVAQWYTLFGTRVGFTFAPGEQSWGAEYRDPQDVDDRTMAGLAADGGSSNIPAKHAPMSDEPRGGRAKFAPERPDADYYVDTGIALARFRRSATGEKLMKRLEQAKDEHGEADGVNDTSVLQLTAGCGIIGLTMGVVVFLL